MLPRMRLDEEDIDPLDLKCRMSLTMCITIKKKKTRAIQERFIKWGEKKPKYYFNILTETQILQHNVIRGK